MSLFIRSMKCTVQLTVICDFYEGGYSETLLNFYLFSYLFLKKHSSACDLKYCVHLLRMFFLSRERKKKVIYINEVMWDSFSCCVHDSDCSDCSDCTVLTLPLISQSALYFENYNLIQRNLPLWHFPCFYFSVKESGVASFLTFAWATLPFVFLGVGRVCVTLWFVWWSKAYKTTEGAKKN